MVCICFGCKPCVGQCATALCIWGIIRRSMSFGDRIAPSTGRARRMCRPRGIFEINQKHTENTHKQSVLMPCWKNTVVFFGESHTQEHLCHLYQYGPFGGRSIFERVSTAHFRHVCPLTARGGRYPIEERLTEGPTFQDGVSTVRARGLWTFEDSGKEIWRRPASGFTYC